jgi:hypothetical protein
MIRPHARIKIFISYSANPDEVNALLSALMVIILKLYSNDTMAFKSDLKAWMLKASPLLLSLGIKKEFLVVVNTLQNSDVVYLDQAATLGKAMAKIKAKLGTDNTVTLAQAKLFNDAAMCLRQDSQPAWKRIEKSVSILRNTKLNTIFLSDLEEVDATPDLAHAIEKMKELCRKLTGRTTNPYMTGYEADDLRKDPANMPIMKEHGAYAALVKKYVTAELLRFVRAAGTDLVSIDSFATHIKKKGVPAQLPIGFTGGQLDEKGNQYTREGRKLDKNNTGPVLMNPKYDPATDKTYVLTDLEGTPKTRARTLNMNVTNRKKRFSKVKTFYENEAKFRKAWLSDLVRKGSKEEVFASMIEIMYQTSSRIGGKENATKGEPTYGLTTLQVHNLEILPTKITFDYSGKMAHAQHHAFSTTTTYGKTIKPIIEKLLVGKGPNDLVFTYKGQALDRRLTNDYLTEKGLPITAHYFRRIEGTKMAMKILKSCPFKKGAPNCTQDNVDAWVKEEMKSIGNVLHHTQGADMKETGLTALKSYVDNEMMGEFFTDLGLRIPNFIPTDEGADE